MLTKEKTLEELKLYYPTLARCVYDIVNRRVVLYDANNNRIDSLHLEAYKGFQTLLYEDDMEISHV